jgi:hypothetical protein
MGVVKEMERAYLVNVRLEALGRQIGFCVRPAVARRAATPNKLRCLTVAGHGIDLTRA